MKCKDILNLNCIVYVFVRYRFICLRNWNLYDSMFYSNYFATKLGIWNEKGKKNLAKFIALLGIPLEEAQ